MYRDTVKEPSLLAPVKCIMWGALWVVAACAVAVYTLGNPVNELALIRHGVTAPGLITDAWKNVETGENGRACWSHGVVYTYTLPDGHEFRGAQHGSGRLREELADLDQPYPTRVEYLPENPDVSRIEGSGCQTVAEWLWRKAGLGAFLLILFCYPAFAVLIVPGIRDVQRILRVRPQSSALADGARPVPEEAGSRAVCLPRGPNI